MTPNKLRDAATWSAFWGRSDVRAVLQDGQVLTHTGLSRPEGSKGKQTQKADVVRRESHEQCFGLGRGKVVSAPFSSTGDAPLRASPTTGSDQAVRMARSGAGQLFALAKLSTRQMLHSAVR